MDKKEYLFKVLVVGECETGKTSVITQYVHRKFENNYKATVSFTVVRYGTIHVPFLLRQRLAQVSLNTPDLQKHLQKNNGPDVIVSVIFYKCWSAVS